MIIKYMSRRRERMKMSLTEVGLEFGCNRSLADWWHLYKWCDVTSMHSYKCVRVVFYVLRVFLLCCDALSCVSWRGWCPVMTDMCSWLLSSNTDQMSCSGFFHSFTSTDYSDLTRTICRQTAHWNNDEGDWSIHVDWAHFFLSCMGCHLSWESVSRGDDRYRHLFM